MAKPSRHPLWRAGLRKGRPMPTKTPHPTWRDLLRMTLETRIPALDPRALQRRQADLQTRFAAIDAELAIARARRDQALARLPADRRSGWHQAVLTAVVIRLGAQRGQSAILPEDAGLPFQRAADGVWLQPQPAAITRSIATSRGGIARAQSAEGRITLILDDTGVTPRILLTLQPITPALAPPVLLAIPSDPAQRPVEIDAEPIPDPDGIRLRFEAILPPGTYDLILGNPRATDHDPRP